MKMINHEKVSNKPYIYQLTISGTRPVSDFTPRVIPKSPGVSVPLETNLILWQH
jgi:starch phosphorylase